MQTSDFYISELYPLQDEALSYIAQAQTDFYLTGGTAVSRVYLNHRFSDDLDLFVNTASPFGENPRYREACNRILAVLKTRAGWDVAQVMSGPYFTRIIVTQSGVPLKIELVDDVTYRAGEVRHHPKFGLVDNPENLLANKITALRDRNEPRDVADVWGLVKKFGLSIDKAITDARSKASGTYHAEIARRLCTATRVDWERIAWINPPDPDVYLEELKQMGDELVLSGAGKPRTPQDPSAQN
jgi:hypothetical protein